MKRNRFTPPVGDDPILDELIDIDDLEGTTLRQCREMAVLTRDGEAQTAPEAGMACCIIYLIDRLVEAERKE